MASPVPPTFSPKNILIIKLRHHGDVLLITPVINALRERFPQAHIDALLYKETLPILEASPNIRHLYPVARRNRADSLWRYLKREVTLMSDIRVANYDLVINLTDQWRSAVVSFLTQAHVRIGFDYPKRRSVIWSMAHNTLVATLNHDKIHTIEQNLSALAPLDIHPHSARPSVHYPESAWSSVKNLLRQQKINTPFIIIQPTARWTFKCWQDEKLAKLIDKLATANIPVILTSGPDKKELGMISAILSLCKTPHVYSLAGQLTLPQLASLLDNARLYIGMDSAPTHMAAALGTPCIALFGPSKRQQWSPSGEKCHMIWAGDYTPMPHPDKINTNTKKRYLGAIPVGDVLDAARKFLNE